MIKLKDCPGTPNCVCSEASKFRFQVDRIPLANKIVWERARRVLTEEMGGTVVSVDVPEEISAENSSAVNYLHVLFQTKLLKFIDDFELLWIPEENSIQVRSASRVGRYDFGVNRKRVAEFRLRLSKYFKEIPSA